MIPAVLDQAQKLFGRGFLIAAFIPSFIFTALIAWILWGFNTVQTRVLQWTQKGWKDAIFDIALVLIIVYILAYVVHGIRSGIHELFQGRWPWPFKYLEHPKLAMSTVTMRRYKAAVDKKEPELDLSAWATENNFEDADSNTRISFRNVASRINKTHKSHRELLKRVKRQTAHTSLVEEVAYWKTLKRRSQSMGRKQSLLRAVRKFRDIYKSKKGMLKLVKRHSIKRRIRILLVNWWILKLSLKQSNVLTYLWRRRKVREKEYWAILREAYLLQANRDRFNPEYKAKIDVLVTCLRTAYKGYVLLRAMAIHLESRVNREWTAAYNELLDNFPIVQREPENESWLQPTRLGNIVGMLELYPFNRYGLNLSDLWPRIFHVVPEDFRLRIEEANIYFDFTVVMSMLSLIATGIVGSGMVGFYKPPRESTPQLLLLFTFMFSFWLFYRLSLQAARNFGIQIQAAIDLFRLKLLEALNIDLPHTATQEMNVWNEMRRFIAQAELPKTHIAYKFEKQKLTEKKDK